MGCETTNAQRGQAALGRSLSAAGKSYSRTEKIVILIATPELEHVATH